MLWPEKVSHIQVQRGSILAHFGELPLFGERQGNALPQVKLVCSQTLYIYFKGMIHFVSSID